MKNESMPTVLVLIASLILVAVAYAHRSPASIKAGVSSVSEIHGRAPLTGFVIRD